MKSKARIFGAAFILLMLTAAMLFCSKAYAASSQCPVYRLSGADRYKTAAAISREGWVKSDYVVIATGEGDDKFADALAGSPLAYALDAPMLLTTTNILNADTQEEILRLGAKKVIILGGTGVVSSDVETQLRNSMGLTVERLWGADRYATAVKIAQRIRTIKPFTKVFVTTGEEFQYAMMISPFASHSCLPILFSQKNSLNSDTKSLISSLGINFVEIIGNESIISTSAEQSLKSISAGVTRISGSDMSETNVNVATKYGAGASWLTVARNDIFADGLAGAAFAAKKAMPIMLVGKYSTDQTIAAYINGFHAEGGYIFGGVGAVFDYVINIIRRGLPNLHVYGNSSGNLNNGGIAAISNGMIYYVNGGQGDKLYKIIANGIIIKTKLTDDRPWHINVVGNWVYYTNFSDGNKIYKIKTDGTCRTKLNDDSSWDLRVVDNWIYYTNNDDNRSIYKIATDGTMRLKQNKNQAMFLNVVNGKDIYYLNENDGRKIYKLNAGDLSDVKAGNIPSYNMEVSGDYIYFTTFDGLNNLYVMKTDGTGLKKLCDDKSTSINKYGDYIYYTNESANYTMYKIKADGTGKAQVYNGSASLMNILPHINGDWIYFSHDTEGLMLYRVRPDGTSLAPVN